MAGLLRDLRHGLRQLRLSPGFTTVVVLTLALGIGAVSSIVTVVNAVLLEGLPYPERLMLVTGVNRAGGGEEEWPISYLDFADWRERTDAFTGLAAHTNPRSFNLLAGNEPERVSGEMVSAGYFRLLGVEPALGRFFTPEEDRPPGDHRVAVLSWGLWQRLFGEAERLEGQTLSLNEESYQVVGVAPTGFAGLTDEAQLWVPVVLAAKVYGPQYIEARPFRWLTVLGRLAPGVTRSQAQAALDAVTAGLEEEYADTNAGIGARLTPLAEAWFGDLRPALANLAAGAVFVLLIACANVANLLLARAAGRQREVALRQALGADRRRLVRQLLTESALLAVVGGGAGLLLSRWVTRALTRLSAVDFQSFVSFQADATVLAVTAAVVLVSLLLFGLAPAWMGSRAELVEVLQEGGKSAGGGRRHRLASLLVVGEVWVAVVLLVAAGLAIRGFQKLRGTDLGFRPEGVITLRADLQGPRLAGQEPRRQLARQLLERLQGRNGIAAAALAGPNIPTDDWLSMHFTLDEAAVAAGAGDEMVVLNLRSVSPGYFATLGVPLLAGRDFTSGDTDQAPFVAIVSRELARRFWPGQEAVGRRLKFGPREGGSPWFTVVGVVGDMRHQGLGGEEGARPDVYFSILHIPPMTPPILNVLARPSGDADAAALAPVLRQELREVAPRLPVYDVKTMAERLDEQVARDRFVLLLMGAFALLALGLAAVGLYGVLAYAVARQTREIGIRMALGAKRGEVIGRVLRRGVGLVMAGLLLGVATAFALTRFLESLLHGLSATDPASFAVACAVLLGVALVASYLPARRAAKVAPVIALREE